MGTPCSFLPPDCSVSENVNILIASSPPSQCTEGPAQCKGGARKNCDPAQPGVSLGSLGHLIFLLVIT